MAEPWEDVIARRIRHVGQGGVCLGVVVLAVLSNGPVGVFAVFLSPIVWLLSWPATMLVLEAPAAALLEPLGEKKRAASRHVTYKRSRAHQGEIDPLRHQGTVRDSNLTADRYGTAHQNLRAAWKDIIRLQGAECMERGCLMPSRRIDAGASWDSWDLAHDHQKGGQHDYLGPAHKICNQAEALRRGVTWEGAPSLSELIDRGQTADAWADRTEPRVDPWARPADFNRINAVEQTDPWATKWPADDEPPF